MLPATPKPGRSTRSLCLTLLAQSIAMEKLLTFLAPLILAWYVAGKLAPAYDQSTSRKIAEVFEKVAGILLPLLILSIVRRMVISDELWLVTIVGFVLPVVFQSAFLASLSVLILMPPSSFLWGRISSLPKADDASYIAPNVFYFAVLGAAFLYGLLHL